MGLVINEGVGERQPGQLRSGCPRGNLAGRAQGVVDALVEIVTDEVIGRLPIESNHRVVLGGEPGRDNRGRRNPFGAVQPQYLFDQIDRAVQVASPAGNGYGPRRATGGLHGLLRAGHPELKGLEGGAHLGRRNIEPEAIGDIVARDHNFARPGNVSANLKGRSSHRAACRFQNQVDGTPSGLRGAVRVHPAFIAIRGIRRQAQPAGRRPNRLAPENRALEH